MIAFTTNIPKYEPDLLDEVRLFVLPDESCDSIAHFMSSDGGRITNKVVINGDEYIFEVVDVFDPKMVKRAAKHAVYLALKRHYKKVLPWGSLTGVRPTKLAYEFIRGGGDVQSIPAYFMREFDVSKKRAALLMDIVAAQSPYMSDFSGKVNLYIHVPFCSSRCNYCSFPSLVARPGDGVIDRYSDYLIREVRETLELTRRQGKTVLSVYIGGGTPTLLPPDKLAELLNALSGLGVEMTFEAGRPDSITTEKLDILVSGGVTRICLNPQSLSDKTLALIGRNHTAGQFYAAYEKVKASGLLINTDIIAGLDGEDAQDFSATLRGITGLSPDNITVHTLSRKRASDNADKRLYNADIEKMADGSIDLLTAAGYRAYYLYKQKYMLGNFENIGYAKPGRECVNNITVMEEAAGVYACGAGAISKNILPDGDIHRFQNAKDIKLYIDEFEIRTAKKYNFLDSRQ